MNSKELGTMWDKIWKSSHYGEHGLRRKRAEEKIKILLKDSLFLKPGMKVLDAGCGDGSTLLFLSEKFRILPFGIDVSEEAIKRARSLFEHNEIKCEFKNADTRSIPFSSNYFDLVLSWGVIEHFNNYDLAIDEFYRVIKPKGILSLIQPHKFSFGPLQRMYLQLLGKWESGFQIEFSGKFLKELLLKKKFKNIRYFITPPFSDFRFVYYADSIVHRFWNNWGHYLYVTASK